GLHHLDGRRRRQGRLLVRLHRRLRLRSRRRQGPHPRLARHHPAPARPGPRKTHLPLRRPRHASHRRQRQGGQGHCRVAEPLTCANEVRDAAEAPTATHFSSSPTQQTPWRTRNRLQPVVCTQLTTPHFEFAKFLGEPSSILADSKNSANHTLVFTTYQRLPRTRLTRSQRRWAK